MIIRFTRTIVLPSGNEARNFRFHSLGYGRVQAAYEYTDRRRNHQVSRHFTAEFMNGILQYITARSARGGRVERFKSSTILAELREMLAEVNRANEALVNFRKDAKRVLETPVKVDPVEQDIISEDDTDLKDTVELLRGVVMINMIITLVTLGIVWYNL